MENIKLPWIPEDTRKNMRSLNPQHEKMTEELIKEIQTHPNHKQGVKHGIMEL